MLGQFPFGFTPQEIARMSPIQQWNLLCNGKTDSDGNLKFATEKELLAHIAKQQQIENQ